MIVNINSIKDKYIQKVIEELAKEGQKIINNAELTAKVTNRSMNLRDAYVYGVYYNGNLVKFGFVGNQQSKSIHSGWAKNNIEADTGRNYARKAIKDYKPNIKKGFEFGLWHRGKTQRLFGFLSSVNERPTIIRKSVNP